MITMKLLRMVLFLGFILFILSPTGTLGAKMPLGTGWINYDLVIYKEVNGTQFPTGTGGGETVNVICNDKISFWIENIRIETDEDVEQYIVDLYVTDSSGMLFTATYNETLEEISRDEVYSTGYGLGNVRLHAGNYTFTVHITDGKESVHLSKNLTVIFSPISDVCPRDSDEDFIADSIDECPNIPGDLDTMGCPPPPPTTTTTTNKPTTTITTTTVPLDPPSDSGILDRTFKGITNLTCRLFGLWC
jgi:hypothetical protein